jgi:hypothetical protein
MAFMSENSARIDARAFLAGWLEQLTGMYVVDINAIPDENWPQSQGGVARACPELNADTVNMLIYTTLAIKGEAEGFAFETNYPKLTEASATKEAAIQVFKEASAGLATAIREASEEAMLAPVATPFGMTMPLFSLAQIAVSHVWYHDGQFNFVQALLGDEKVHWMP